MTTPRLRPAALALLALPALLAGACRTAAPPATAPARAATAATAAAPGLVVAPARAELTAGGTHARVTAPAPGVFRVELWREGAAPPGPSFAVDPVALATPVPLQVDEADAAVTIRAGAQALRVGRAPLTLTLLDAQGRVVAEEAAPVAWQQQGALLSWKLGAGEHAFGLGDKAKAYDRRGQSFELWNSDAYGWNADRDPLYKSIPFLLLLSEGRAHGIFVDSPVRGFVDVGEGDPAKLTWQLDRGAAVDVYLFAGPTPREVITAYTGLTGRTPLPPRWALGYHQSRYGYLTGREVREVAARLRADRIPTDAIWLDIDYQDHNRPFSVDPVRFAGFPKLVADLRGQGLRTVVITDPHVAEAKGTVPYDTGVAGDHFVHEASGPVFVGEVWPGPSVFPEFTLARTRAWWGGLYRDFVDQGVAGFWNDMNEPAIFDTPTKTMPEDTPHRLDGGGAADHVVIHNAYGLLNARATYEGVQALRPGVRPFVLTRAAYAGAQRWAASWTGDNRATREHLALTVPTLLNLGASGYAFVGADVGGFVGCPSPELLTAWMEVGAFQPFFRNHSEKESCRREPWVNGPVEEGRRRAAVERRYRLLPYLYTAFEESARTGLPVMRPLWLEYPADPAAVAEARAWLLGRDLLVAPDLAGDGKPYAVALPAGGWWDTRTGARLEGGAPAQVTPAAGEAVRVFARAGAIVPEQPVAQTAGERPQGPLTVHVWPGPACEGALYLDDGETLAYRDGAWRRVAFACQAAADGVTLTATSTGGYAPWWSATEVVVHGVPRAPRPAAAGQPAPRWDAAAHTATVAVPGGGAAWSVALRW